MDTFSICVQPPADKSTARQNDSPGLYSVLRSRPANIEFKILIGLVPDLQYLLLRKVLNFFGAQPSFKSFLEAQAGNGRRYGRNFEHRYTHQLLQVGDELMSTVQA